MLTQNKKKRGRTSKKNIQNSIQTNEVNSSITFSNTNDFDEDIDDDFDDDKYQTQVAFGDVNITINKSNNHNIKEIREHFNNVFGKIESGPTVLSQKETSEKIKSTIKKPIDISSFFQDTQKNVNNDELEYKYEHSETQRNTGIQQNQQIINNKKISFVKNIISLLSDITNNPSWPECTNILCWWCSHTFNTYPIPCPINHCKKTNKFNVKGIFCSVECMAAFSMDEYNTLSFVYLFIKNLTTEPFDINIAPTKYLLKSFGGKYTIDEFRNYYNNKFNNKFIISTDYISYANQDIVEIYSEITNNN